MSRLTLISGIDAVSSLAKQGRHKYPETRLTVQAGPVPTDKDENRGGTPSRSNPKTTAKYLHHRRGGKIDTPRTGLVWGNGEEW